MNWVTKILLGVGIPAFALFIYVKIAIEHLRLAYAIGEAIGATLVPLALALIWNGFSARSERRKLGPGVKPAVSLGAVITAWLIIGASVFGSITYEQDEAARQAVAAAPWPYKGPGCDLGVVFPGVPTVNQVPVPGEGMSEEQAELLLPEAYLRAECVRYPASLVFSKEQVDLYIRNYIAQQGLSDVVLLAPDQSLGLAVGARGNKQIEGAGLATYETTMIFREGSMLALVTASRAHQYPTPAIMAFRGSVSVSP